MESKKWITELLLGVFAIGITSCATTEDSKFAKPAQPPKQQQAGKASDSNVPFTLHKEADTTDSLAVPSDSTEEELDEEMEELNDLQKQPKNR